MDMLVNCKTSGSQCGMNDPDDRGRKDLRKASKLTSDYAE